MTNEHFVTQNTVGCVAEMWIPHETQGFILGHTSSGLFLQLPQEQNIIYLTNYPDYGPINLNVSTPLPEQWIKGKSLDIFRKNGAISFNQSHKNLSVDNFKIWKNAPPLAYTINKDTLNQRIIKTGKQLSIIKGKHGFTPLFSQLFNTQQAPPNTELNLIWETIQRLKTSCLEQDSSAFLTYSTPLLSYGRGLTPSGDDFLCGLIYCFIRKSGNKIINNFINSIKIPFLTTAKERTTSISVSLLTCAFMGEAHSRTQEMTDTLTTEEIPFENQAIRMAGWGSSSGADTTLGIVIASQIIQTIKG